MKEIKDNILPKIGDFVASFYDIELKLENILENLLIIKLFFEIILNFLTHLDYPANLVLLLLRYDEQLLKIHEKYKNFFKANCENDEKIQKSWTTYFKIFEQLTVILDKFKHKIKAEGSDIKFTQSSEVK